MKSRTREGPLPYLWSWFQSDVWEYWRVRRVTSRYILITPTERNPTLGTGSYCLIRWPSTGVLCSNWSCLHDAHPGTLCSDKDCMCPAGEDEDGEYVP